MNEKDEATLSEITELLMLKFGYEEKLKPVVTRDVKNAYSKALGYTNQESLISDIMSDAVYELAVIALNKDGNEGESSRSEGGVSQSFIDGFPSDIKSSLNGFRIAKVRSLL